MSYGIALAVVAVAFRVMERVVKRILKIVTVPLNVLTLGLAGFVVNVLLFFVLQAVLNVFSGGAVGIELGSLSDVAILSIALSFASSFI